MEILLGAKKFEDAPNRRNTKFVSQASFDELKLALGERIFG